MNLKKISLASSRTSTRNEYNVSALPTYSSQCNSSNLQSPPLIRDPPPPYWVHHNHPILDDSTSESDTDNNVQIGI